MVRSRFTEEQIADFLQQSKNGVPNKALCEEYGFSNSTLRRWQEKHAESVRQELKQIESTAKIVFLCFIAAAILLTLMFPKPTAALAIPPYLVYCISYIRRFRRISGDGTSPPLVLARGQRMYFTNLAGHSSFLCLHIAFYSCLNKP